MKNAILLLTLLLSFSANAQNKGNTSNVGTDIQSDNTEINSVLDPNYNRDNASARWLMQQAEQGKLKGFVTNPHAGGIVLDPWTAGCIWTGSQCTRPNAVDNLICDIENESCINGFKGNSVDINGFIGFFC